MHNIRTTILLNLLFAVAIIALAHFVPHSAVYWGAAVTVAARYPKRDYSNGRKSKIFKFSIAANGDFLDSGLRDADAEIDVDPTSVITSIARSTVNGQTRFTFTTTGAAANLVGRVTARN